MVKKDKTRLTITLKTSTYLWLKEHSKKYGTISKFIQTWIGDPDSKKDDEEEEE